MADDADPGRAVLQRHQHVAVWGDSTCATGTEVEVQLDSFVVAHAHVDHHGSWQTKLPPQGASFKRTLSLRVRGNRTMDVGVAFGEVILCAGQSNMGIALYDTKHHTSAENGKAEAEHVRQAGRYDDKIFLLGTFDSEIAVELTPLRWKGLNNLEPFSALCWHTGKELYGQLKRRVPIGLLLATRGGTPYERWLPPTWVNEDTTRACGIDRPACSDKDPNIEDSDSDLYELYIKPMAPYTLGSFFWDGGEADVACHNPDAKTHINRVPCLQSGLINSYRSAEYGFDSDFVFLSVQLPGYTSAGERDWDYSLYHPGIFRMRLLQDAPLNALPHAETMPTYDLGCDAGIITKICPRGTVHNLNKRPIGLRAGAQLARLLKRDEHGTRSYPRVVAATFKHTHHADASHNATYAVHISFEGGNPPLSFKPTQNCHRCCGENATGEFDVIIGPSLGGDVPEIELYGVLNDLHPKLAAINATRLPKVSGQNIQFDVKVPNGSVPLYVRYTANQLFPQCALVDKDRQPAYPFQLLLQGHSSRLR
jgi:hypothetical protein